MTFKRVLFFITVLVVPSLAHSQSWQWFDRMGGAGYPTNISLPDEKIMDMVTDSAGNVYVCGRIVGQTNPDINGTPVPGYGGYDLFVAAFDCHGNLKWAQTGGGFTDSDEATNILLDHTDHLYVCGRINSQPTPWATFMGIPLMENTNDMFLCKLDTGGNVLWSKFASPGSSNVLSRTSAMEFDSQGNIHVMMLQAVAGTLYPGFVQQPGSYIITFDTSGTMTNAINLIGPNTGGYTYSLDDIKIDTSDNIYITGDFVSDSLIISGQVLYRQSIIADMVLYKINSAGTVQWFKHVVVNDTVSNSPNGIALKDDALYLAARGRYGDLEGIPIINTLSQNSFTYVARYDLSGALQWVVNSGNSLPLDSDGGIYLTDNNHVVISGLFGSQIQFGPYSLTQAQGSGSIYMAQLDTSGNWLSAEKLQFNGGSYNIPQCITSDSNNNIYLGGGFEGSIIVNGNTTTYVGGYSDAFLTKYGYVCTVGLDESLTANSGKLFLYPNPVSDYLNVNVDGMEGVVTVMLYNIMGQVVQSQQLQLQQQSQIVLPVQGIPSGVYSLVVSDNKHQLTGRVVIERL